MTNTTASAVLGPLAPGSTSYESDDAVADVVGDIVAGILGLDRNNVRPRFQLGAPPQMPGPTADWLAIGTASVREESMRGIVTHVGDGDGADYVQTPERHEMLLSFYGPHGLSMARKLRDGLKVAPNRYAVRAAGLAYVGSGPIINLGEEINSSWYRRADMTVRLDGIVIRDYPVLNLLSVQGSFVAVRSRVGQPAAVATENFKVEV